MDAFERLADTGSELLDHLAACRPEGEVVLPEAAGLEGWLHVVFDTAMDAPTARLRVRTDRWGLSEDDEVLEFAELYWVGADSARFPRHPPVHTLSHDVFTSSATVIDCWLSPEEILYLDQPLGRLAIRAPLFEVPNVSEIIKPAKAVKPSWDCEGRFRELWFGETLIKKFAQPSDNQVQILKTFQDEGWPQRIEAPKYLRADSKKLGDAVTALNKHHFTPGVLRFTRDGLAAGVCWEAIDK
jgi:hypothetical protein